jgi:hypothetical protein
MGNIHIANGSTRTVWVSIGHEKVAIPDIESLGKVGQEPYKIAASVRASLDRALEEAEFRKIGANEALSLKPDLAEDEVYVSIISAEDPALPSPQAALVICYNNSLPDPGLSVLLTSDGSVQLSKPCGKFWKTKTGICYEHLNEPTDVDSKASETGKQNASKMKENDMPESYSGDGICVAKKQK